ncbi:hypothetical protein HX746_31590 (plasmid) [Rhodococcus erythropolis]|uniref:hypothetical protein n=1 Tax=Rhodococcus erythropolis TaxID=1833 RepID=UPI001AD99EAC|nr:hypothetical protein [Rhodococcus erythropolis]MBO8150812.1 hypothetical protein [Rhodococcus erythropolis]
MSTSGYYQYVKRRATTVLTPKQQRRADLEVKIIDPQGFEGYLRVTSGHSRVARTR